MWTSSNRSGGRRGISGEAERLEVYSKRGGDTCVVGGTSASRLSLTFAGEDWLEDAGGEENEGGACQGSRVEGRRSEDQMQREQKGRGIDECVGSCKPKPKHEARTRGGDEGKGRNELGLNDRVCTEYMSTVSGSRDASGIGRARERAIERLAMDGDGEGR